MVLHTAAAGTDSSDQLPAAVAVVAADNLAASELLPAVAAVEHTAVVAVEVEPFAAAGTDLQVVVLPVAVVDAQEEPGIHSDLCPLVQAIGIDSKPGSTCYAPAHYSDPPNYPT